MTDIKLNTLPLVLGGHSFIKQLGNDPCISAKEQTELVGACLDNNIRWFDTTYQPERAALGGALKELGRRGEANIIAWNFFKDFGPDDTVGGPDFYQPHHIELMLGQLQTDYIDYLVVHWIGDDRAKNQEQEILAAGWKQKGFVKKLGLWDPGEEMLSGFGRKGPYEFVVCPFNVSNTRTLKKFAVAKELGWETFSCSPFVRGWELEKLAKKAAREGAAKESDMILTIADRMLRYSLYGPGADRLIVSMRKREWVQRNAESALKGKLSADDKNWLEHLAG